MVLIAQCVAGRNVLDSNNRGDVARITRFDVFALVGLDLDQTRDAYTFVRARIVNGVAFRKCAGIDAEENEFPDKWIPPKCKSEGAEVPIIVRQRFDRLA